MKLHRFLGNFDFKKGNLKIFDKAIINQIKNVLRFETSDKVILCDGKMQEAITAISVIGKDFVEFEIKEVFENKNDSEIYGILYCSILKRDNFEIVVQKATETGIKEIVPIISKRAVKLNLNLNRLNKIIKEATEQSERGIMPVLNLPIEFSNALKTSNENNLNLFFDKTGDDIFKIKKKSGANQRIGIWIGPEGGWDSEEINMAEESNFKTASLGKFTLRAETAVIIASYIVMNFK